MKTRLTLLALALSFSCFICGPGIAAEIAPLVSIEKPADYDQLTLKLTAEQAGGFEKQAEAGDAFGTDAALLCALYGFGGPCHFDRARKWLKRGEELHTPVAAVYQAKCLTGYWLDGRTSDPEKANALAAQAVAYFRPLAEKGSVFAQTMLGHALLVQKADESIAVLKKVAEQGDAVAQCTLGDVLFRGEAAPQNYDESLRWFQKSAEQGLAVALHSIGAWHYIGPKQDFSEAVKWYRKGAERGFGMSLAMMVEFCCKGHGVPADPLAAVRWQVLANQQGFINNRYLSDYDPADAQFKRSPQEIVDWFVKKAAEGSADHLDAIGIFYENGFGLPKDQEKAIVSYEKAIDLGHHEAVHDLVKCYIYGNGGWVNEPEVFKWSQRAVALGCNQGLRQLADCYEFGWGTPRDTKKVLELCEQAFKNGDVNLASRIAQLKGHAEADKRKEQQVQQLEVKAAAGDADAMQKVAAAYETGVGAPRDAVKAIEWQGKAAAAGNIDACAAMGAHYANGDGVQVNLLKAYTLLKQAAASGQAQRQREFGLFLESHAGQVPANNQEMFDAYKFGAAQGDKRSILQVARCYNWGRGVSEDCNEAIKYYEKIMDMDFRPKFEVGMILVLGRGGVAQDLKRGFALVAEAANTPNAGDPQFELGRLYHEGLGTPKDDVKATEWLKKSKAAGNANANKLLRDMASPQPAPPVAPPAAPPIPKPPAPPSNADF